MSDSVRGMGEDVEIFPLFAQRIPLRDAEAVLFVADAEGEAAELHIGLQNGMGAAEDIDLPSRQGLLDLALLLCRGRAREVPHLIIGKSSL